MTPTPTVERNEVVERVARGLRFVMYGVPLDREMAPDSPWFAYAKTAIGDMRDLPPSVTTIEDCDRWTWTCCTCGGPKENWQAFVDAALGRGGV